MSPILSIKKLRPQVTQQVMPETGKVCLALEATWPFPLPVLQGGPSSHGTDSSKYMPGAGVGLQLSGGLLSPNS